MSKDFALPEMLEARGWRFTAHNLALSGAIGHGTDSAGITLAEWRATTKEVIGAKCGINLDGGGTYSLVVDADTNAIAEQLRNEDIFSATLQTRGSKGGHFFFEVDKKIPKQKIMLDEKTTAIDILGDGSMAVIPPSLHRKTKKPYTILKNAEPKKVSWNELEKNLLDICKKNNLIWKNHAPDWQKIQPVRDANDEIEQIKNKVKLWNIEPRIKAGLQSSPFRQDKNPSFSVNEGGTLWHDFSTDEGGDVFTIFEEINKCDFTTAKKELMKKAGIAHVISENGADILLNPIVQEDRFGCGLKNGKPYFGVPVANAKGDLLPAVFYGDRLIFGTDALEAQGFLFSDFQDAEVKINRELLHAHLKNPKEARATSVLIEEIVALMKKYIHHPDDAVYYIATIYVMLSYIYFAFNRTPRICVIGLPNSGKSTLTDFMAYFANNPLTSGDASKASLFRAVEQTAGAIIIDNFDKLSEDSKMDFAQIYDISFEQGRDVRRADKAKGKMTSRRWRTYCPMIVNCETDAWLKTSSRTRSIFIRMTINTDAKLEKVETFPKEEADRIRQDLLVWATANCQKFATTKIENSFNNRCADIAKPLMLIANELGENVSKKVQAYLKENFATFQTEDDFSDSSITLMAIWDFALANATAKNPLFSFTPKELAERTCSEKGIHRVDENGRSNPHFEKNLHRECSLMGGFLRSLPYEKHDIPNNRSTYVFNIIKFKHFLKSRGFALKGGDEIPDAGLEGCGS